MVGRANGLMDQAARIALIGPDTSRTMDLDAVDRLSIADSLRPNRENWPTVEYRKAMETI